MTEQYERSTRLIIKDRIKGIQIDVQDLRVSFKIDKTNEPNSNGSQISVYNLNQDHRAIFGKVGNEVQLFVGHTGLNGDKSLVKSIFIGDISRATTEKKGPDFITKFEAGDKEIAIEETEFNKTYAPKNGQPIWLIIQDIATKMGLIVNKENLKSVSKEVEFANPVTFSGKIKDVMENLSRKLELEWNVQDGELRVREKLEANVANAIEISKDSGLIGIPIKREKGMNFIALLNPLIRPTVTVNIISDQSGTDLSGHFIVTKTVYTGDNREGDWIASCEAISVNEAKKEKS